jgi:hypothetical protein
MPGTQAVPERFHPILSALIDMIADGDVAAIRADPAIRVGAGDPLLWVRDYPDIVTALPPQGWDLADAVRIDGHPDLWSVVIRAVDRGGGPQRSVARGNDRGPRRRRHRGNRGHPRPVNNTLASVILLPYAGQGLGADPRTYRC